MAGVSMSVPGRRPLRLRVRYLRRQMNLKNTFALPYTFFNSMRKLSSEVKRKAHVASFWKLFERSEVHFAANIFSKSSM
jgi:hypothetical protein